MWQIDEREWNFVHMYACAMNFWFLWSLKFCEMCMDGDFFCFKKQFQFDVVQLIYQFSSSFYLLKSECLKIK